MIVTFPELKKRILKRLGKMDIKDLNFYIVTFLNIIKERISKDIPIIIDNFGTISRKKKKRIKVMNVVTKEHIYIQPFSIVLIPNNAFLKYIYDPENLKFLKKKIIDNSKKMIDEKTGKLKRVV